MLILRALADCSATADHHSLVPHRLTSLVRRYRVSAFELTLSSGRWSPTWPIHLPASIPASGIELTAWLELLEGESDDDERRRWEAFTSAVSGLFCAGIASDGIETSTASPTWAVPFPTDASPDGPSLLPRDGRGPHQLILAPDHVHRAPPVPTRYASALGSMHRISYSLHLAPALLISRWARLPPQPTSALRWRVHLDRDLFRTPREDRDRPLPARCGQRAGSGPPRPFDGSTRPKMYVWSRLATDAPRILS